MILLQANNLARLFGEQVLYQDVNFNIQTHDRIALVGRNGAGKSTLISQIMKTEPISKGEITLAKDIRIGYLEQHVAIDSDLTIWEEMLAVFQEALTLREQTEEAAQTVADLSVDPESKAYQEALDRYDQLQEELNRRNAYAVESDIRTVLHGFRFYEEDYDTPVQSLSGGQKTRLALARILLMDYDLLILDEPTNHLDMETLTWLEGYLQGYRGALLIVSHDRYFLNRVANQVIELRNQTSHIYKGNYDFFLKERDLRLQQEWQAYEKQQVEIHKLQDFVDRNLARASTTKRAQSRRKQLERMDKIEKPRQDDKAPRIQFSAELDSGDQVIAADDLAVGYSSNLDPIACHLNLDLRRQQAVAIVGPNGVGKSTFLKTLIGQLTPLAGEVHIGTNVSIGYYDQNVNHLNENLTVLETLWQAQDTTDEWKVRSILGSFLFSGETVEKKVSMLSGGEKARLALALLATEHDNTLLLDEPTNHLDISSKEVLEDALIDFNGTLLFVSHDRYFINRIATHVLEIGPTGSTLYLGDYDYYTSKKAELAEMQANNDLVDELPTSPTPDKEKSANQLSYEENKQVNRRFKQLQKRVDQALQDNDQLEETIEQLNQALLEASNTNDMAGISKHHQDLLKAQEQQELALNDWEEASLELESFLDMYPHLNQS
ncbi:ABC-F family ATP-binding cassette domain-containing protein [Hutsoniella sourekii]|uniref:ABC-F family ATP-binding cassette domain-containing protein n=1 Tax=Hutsoniella sourekii TaxID=87650 RepID=UPI0004833BA8|nr:ABC-F family ATP-binding cassette domain-containing protein [Hutsoniella sourekii]